MQYKGVTQRSLIEKPQLITKNIAAFIKTVKNIADEINKEADKKNKSLLSGQIALKSTGIGF
jgi:hypothetical protein